MRKFLDRGYHGLLVAVAAVAVSSCAATTAVQTGRAPTAQEFQAQLKADLVALQLAGCVTQAAGQVAAPILAVTVDGQGQRVASAIDQVSGKVCSVPVGATP